jgi:hypothetical protein
VRVIAGEIEVETEDEALIDCDPEKELVLVRKRLDSELQGLGDGLELSDGEALSERLPEGDEVVVILVLAVCVFVGIFEIDSVDVPVYVEAAD